MKKFTDPRMHDCIQHCWDCRDTCQATLYNYCLAQGGHHVEQAHVRLQMRQEERSVALRCPSGERTRVLLRRPRFVRASGL